MLARKLPLTVLDQAVMSGASFVLTLLVARAESREAFGAFALAYAVLLFSGSLLMALVLKPFILLGEAREGAAFRCRLGAYVTGQLVLSGAIGTTVAMVGAVLLPSELRWTFVALGWAIPPMHLLELLRRAQLARLTVRRALAYDMVFAGTLVAGLLGLRAIGELSAAAALTHLGVSAVIAAALSVRDLGVRPSRSLDVIRSEGTGAWQFARWSGGVTLLDAVEARVYAFVVAAAVGLAGPAALEIARTIVSPTNVVVFPVLNLLMPLSGRLFLEGQGPALLRVTLHALTVTGVATAAYGLLAAIGADVLIAVLYGERYADVSGVVRLFCAYHVLASMSGVASVSLESIRRPRAVFFAQLGAVIAGVLVAWLSMEALGIAGAVVGMIAGTVVGLTGKVFVLARATAFASRPCDIAIERV